MKRRDSLIVKAGAALVGFALGTSFSFELWGARVVREHLVLWAGPYVVVVE